MHDTPFKSLQEALARSYAIEHFSPAPASQLGRLNVLWKAETSVQERFAQAAMIRLHVSKHLLPVEAAYIECWYRIGPGKNERQHEIVEAILPQVIGSSVVVKRRLILLLVKRYFSIGKSNRQSQREIAQIVGHDVKTVNAYEGKVIDAVAALGRRAEARLEDDFKRTGVIP